MVEPNTLTLAFVKAHPAEAARVLATLPPEAPAALFEQLPARLGAPVLEAMPPAVAARCVLALGQSRAQAILSLLGSRAAVAVLRHVPEAQRGPLLAGLSTASALASRVLLGYPEDTIGAWTDTSVVSLGPDQRAAEALTRVRAAHDASLVLVTAEDRLLGVVGLAALLRAAETARLAELMQPAPAVLLAAAPVLSAVNHRGWERAAALPVMARGDRFLGLLHHHALARAMAEKRPAQVASEGAGLSETIARGYWEAFSAVVSTALSLLPAVPKVSQVGDGH